MSRNELLKITIDDSEYGDMVELHRLRLFSGMVHRFHLTPVPDSSLDDLKLIPDGISDADVHLDGDHLILDLTRYDRDMNFRLMLSSPSSNFSDEIDVSVFSAISIDELYGEYQHDGWNIILAEDDSYLLIPSPLIDIEKIHFKLIGFDMRSMELKIRCDPITDAESTYSFYHSFTYVPESRGLNINLEIISDSDDMPTQRFVLGDCDEDGWIEPVFFRRVGADVSH